MDPPAEDPIAELITAYNELNANTIEELFEEPSPLEFMRYVARNCPFVVRGGASDWPAVRDWSAENLRQKLRGHLVNVAVTPYGNADAPTREDPDYYCSTDDDGVQDQDVSPLLFAKPHEEDQPFEEFLDYLIRQEKKTTCQDGGGGEEEEEEYNEVRYAQTQNDNLRHEYSSLYDEGEGGRSGTAAVQRTIPFARVALGRDPDAVNMWVGGSRSVTAMHRDNYENIYVQVRGRKHFVLLPALCQPCVAERDLVPATYVRRVHGDVAAEGEKKNNKKSNNNNKSLQLVRDSILHSSGGEEEEEGREQLMKGDISTAIFSLDTVPFATWDPDRPEENATKYSHLAEPMRVTLEPGDMLYLPAMWYHKVSQSCSEDGICVAVNYWYDMEFSGPLYPLTSFVRSVNNDKNKKDNP